MPFKLRGDPLSGILSDLRDVGDTCRGDDLQLRGVPYNPLSLRLHSSDFLAVADLSLAPFSVCIVSAAEYGLWKVARLWRGVYCIGYLSSGSSSEIEDAVTADIRLDGEDNISGFSSWFGVVEPLEDGGGEDVLSNEGELKEVSEERTVG